MKMRSAHIMAAVLCAALAFTGCTGNQPSATPSDPSSASAVTGEQDAEKLLTEVWQINDIQTTLRQDGGFDMIVETMDSEGNITALTNARYTMDGENISYCDVTTNSDGAVITSNESVQESKDVAAVYTVLTPAEPSDKIPGKMMVILPAVDHLSYLENMNPITMWKKAGAAEQAVSVSMQDDKQILETTLTMAGLDGSKQRYYYLNPQTKQADVILTYNYDKDGNETGSERVDYIQKAELTTSARKEVLDDAGCKLKVVIDYAAKENTDHFEQEFSVAKDTSVLFYSDSSYTLYSDAQHTNELDRIDVSGDQATVYVLIDAE